MKKSTFLAELKFYFRRSLDAALLLLSHECPELAHIVVLDADYESGWIHMMKLPRRESTGKRRRPKIPAKEITPSKIFEGREN
ncbi:hypothetical protein ACFSQT_06585 [Mesorhizobium calcicola]|uniref:Transposase n=1 Tax=Mesorhizobium calcicola TaxID=1300310 RepID=A0ABW4W9D8_9HYPH